ncbi:unnamed protein product, partial [Chrysoparadoxa australica]
AGCSALDKLPPLTSSSHHRTNVTLFWSHRNKVPSTTVASRKNATSDPLTAARGKDQNSAHLKGKPCPGFQECKGGWQGGRIQLMTF